MLEPGIFLKKATVLPGVDGRRPAPEVQPGWFEVFLDTGTLEQELEVLKWAYTNTGDDWQWCVWNGRLLAETGLHFQFRSSNDAMIFKLRWSGQW